MTVAAHSGRIAQDRIIRLTRFDPKLSIATLSTMFVGGWMLAGGKKKEQQQQGPPINASSKDEENFIQCVMLFYNTPKQWLL